MTERLRVLIYGSCVSRDSFRHFDESRFGLFGYHARHSLISAFSRASKDVVADVSVESRFQRRMLDQDATSEMTRRLRDRESPRPDVVLWDLVDERHGVIELPDGGHITVSTELLDSGFVWPAAWRHIPFGTDEHFDLWSRRLGSFSRLLMERGLQSRTVLLCTAWAPRTESGAQTHASHGLAAHDADGLYERYYTAAASLPAVRILEMTPVEAVAADVHRWGPAPFHFTDAYYQTVAARFAALHPAAPGL